MDDFRKPFSWVNPKAIAKDTIKCGKGVFAESEIKKDEIVCIFGGYVMPIEDEKDLPDEISDHSLQISDDFVIGLNDKDDLSIAEYFNHSCEPNAGFGGQITLRAMRDIAVGEEITFDYAMVLGESSKVDEYKLECMCGRKSCRGIITDKDWMIDELQSRYDGYFQWYLQEKINKMKK